METSAEQTVFGFTNETLLNLFSADNSILTSVASKSSKNTSAFFFQVIKMLAVVVAMFAILWLPYRGYVVYNSFAKVRFECSWCMLACRLMIYMNSALNPVLYNAMSSKFRRSFLRLLFFGGRRHHDQNMQMKQANSNND